MGNDVGYLQQPTLAATRRTAYRGVGQVFRSVVHLVFPPTCTTCQCEMDDPDDDVLICERCRLQCIDRRSSCRFCGAGIGEGVNPAVRCLHCLRDRFRFATVVRLGDYDGPLQRAILTEKQGLHGAVAIHLGRLLATVRGAELHALQCDGVVAVPAHWTRQSKHGHNSAEVIARQVARRLGLPLVEQLLKRVRATRPQTELTPRERRANVKEAFSVRNHPDLRDARLLLVDDVLTTGATANEISMALLAAGAASVAVAVLARAVGPK